MKKPTLPRPLVVKEKDNTRALTLETPRSADSTTLPQGDALILEIARSGGDSNSSRVEVSTPLSNNPIEQPHMDTKAASIAKSKKRPKNFKPRGPNKCKRLATLKEGEKLELSFFYQNGAVGEHHRLLTSYMGMLIKDPFIVLVRVCSWNDIDEVVKDHLWASISNKFKGIYFDLDRVNTLRHVKKIWHTWRGYLKQRYIKHALRKEDAIENGPKSMQQADWEWLISEHFFNPEFLKVRSRNSKNRAHLTMPHRTGCAPFRQIAYDQMGGKEGNDSTIAEVFKKTREKKSGGLDNESASKLVLIEKGNENPELLAFELVEECFGLQNKGHVTCFGFGMKPKDVRGALPSRVDLQAMLRNKEKENASLHTRLDKLEEQFQKFANQQSRRDVENVDNAENVAG